MGLASDLAAERKTKQFWAFKEKNEGLDGDASGESNCFQG